MRYSSGVMGQGEGSTTDGDSGEDKGEALGSAPAFNGCGKSCGSSDLYDLAGNKGSDRHGPYARGVEMEDLGDPQRAANEEQESRKNTGARGTKIQRPERKGPEGPAGCCCYEWIREKVSARGSEELDKTTGRVGIEDRKTDGSFGEIKSHGRESGRGTEHESNEKNTEVLEGKGNRSEGKRDGDMCASRNKDGCGEGDRDACGDRLCKGPGRLICQTG